MLRQWLGRPGARYASATLMLESRPLFCGTPTSCQPWARA